MRRLVTLLLIILTLLIFLGLHYADKEYFLCPIDYTKGILIRQDSRGDGVFDAPRSGGRRHSGVDLLAPVGFPVRAARLGFVAEARFRNGMGNYVKIRHPGGVMTLYGHLNKIYARQGEIVRQGDVIGEVGKTGNAIGNQILPHLHLEVHKDGIVDDPLQYLN